jgi:hypothetical protein
MIRTRTGLASVMASQGVAIFLLAGNCFGLAGALIEPAIAGLVAVAPGEPSGSVTRQVRPDEAAGERPCDFWDG